MKQTAASKMALGGVLAALAVVIMCMGGIIPVATFVLPMLCMLLLTLVIRSCGNRIAWAWYGAVSILSLLLGPDKEAAAVFTFLGYYPIIRPWFEKLPLKNLWKLVYFNAVVLAMYWLLMHLFAMAQLLAEFREMGIWMTLITLAMGNVTFWLLDRLLAPGVLRRKRRG